MNVAFKLAQVIIISFLQGHVCASNITMEEISMLWPDVEFVNCPTTDKNCKMIAGDTYEEVMQAVLNDLQLANISESDFENFERKLSRFVPQEVLDRVNNMIEKLDKCMEGLSVDSSVLLADSVPEKIEFCTQLRHNLQSRVVPSTVDLNIKLMLLSLDTILEANIDQFKEKMGAYTKSRESNHANWKGFLDRMFAPLGSMFKQPEKIQVIKFL